MGSKVSSSTAASAVSIDASEACNNSHENDSSAAAVGKPRQSPRALLARLQRSSAKDCESRTDESASFLSQEDVDFLSRQTGLTVEQVRIAHTEFHRISSAGRLTQSQFRQLYKLLIKQDTDERVEAISSITFRAFDHDRSGYIEFGEFLVGFAIACKGDLKSRLSYAFDCYDANYSTYIEKDEIQPVLVAMLQLLGIQHPEDYEMEKMVCEIMDIVDSSQDGRISKQEFVEALSADAFVRGMLNPFN
ncbi:hypothetical protein ACOME3_002964 [Neoechinorhynchus agilis]